MYLFTLTNLYGCPFYNSDSGSWHNIKCTHTIKNNMYNGNWGQHKLLAGDSLILQSQLNSKSPCPGKQPCFSAFWNSSRVGTIWILGRIVFLTAGALTEKAHSLGPARWNFLIDRTWHMPSVRFNGMGRIN